MALTFGAAFAARTGVAAFAAGACSTGAGLGLVTGVGLDTATGVDAGLGVGLGVGIVVGPVVGYVVGFGVGTVVCVCVESEVVACDAAAANAAARSLEKLAVALGAGVPGSDVL